MAKHRGKKKGKRSKRAAAARKAWRTRKRKYGKAGRKHRGGKKGKRKGRGRKKGKRKGHRGSGGHRSRGKKKGRKLKRGQHRGIVGGTYSKKSFGSFWEGYYKKKGKRKKKRGLPKALRDFNRANPPMVCRRCGRTIFGGAKGARTHARKNRGHNRFLKKL